LGAAGGLLGLAAAGPLAAGIAPWGAGLLLGAVALGGLVVLTRVPVRVVAETTATTVRPAGSALGGLVRRSLGGLCALGRRDDAERQIPRSDPDADADLADDEPVEPPPTPTKPRARKPKVTVPEEPIAEAQQLDLELRPAVKGSPWKLPSP